MTSPTTEIHPLSIAHVDALLAGDEVFTALFGSEIASGYLDEPNVLSNVRAALEDGLGAEWFGHLAVDADTGVVVGFAGFKGPPHDGEVEIGYSIAPAYRHEGRATAVVEQLLERARDRGVSTVCAHTLPYQSPSTRLLARTGFRYVETFVDEHLGEVWRWELVLT